MRGDGPPYVKLGRAIRYREGALVQWMKSRHATVDERAVATESVIRVQPRSVLANGIIVHLQYISIHHHQRSERRLGRNIQYTVRYILLTISQIALKYITGHPHPSPSYEDLDPHDRDNHPS